MSEYSKPEPKVPGNPKIAPVIPITSAPAEKQAEYAEFVKALEQVPSQRLEEAPEVVESVRDTPLLVPIVDTDSAEPTDEDKAEFVRSILGDFDYRKSFVLFGAVSAVFTDRSVELTERMYEQLDKDSEDKLGIDSEEGYAVWLDRYIAAATLVRLEYPEKKILNDLDQNDTSNLYERAKKIMSLPKPMYTAVLETSRTFDTHVGRLVERAQDENFWQTDGVA